MKALPVFILLLSAHVSFSQPLAKGDNIYAAFRKIKKTREALMPPIGNWAEESNITAVGDDAAQTPGTVFFRTKENRLFAAHNYKEGTVVIDLDGDSVIDIETTMLWLPEWAIKKTSATAKDTVELYILNSIYQSTMQADQNDYADSTVANLLNRYRTNTTLPNRNIFYLFDSYRRITLDAAKQKQKVPAALCLHIADLLSKECMTAFGKVPAIVVVYKGEAMLNSSLYGPAREHFRTWLAYYPNSIPLQVYDCKMEENKVEKAKKKSALKAKHPNHWMVKELDN